MTCAPVQPVAVKRPRFEVVDAARGVALAGMFVFHLVWDLGFFLLIPPEWPYTRGFMAFGHTVAGAFFFLVGFSLVLASRGGLDRQAFARRFAQIVAAAAAITAVTTYLFPTSFIFFGVLHCIALSMLVALPFRRAPVWLAAVVALIVALAPLVVASAMFDQPLWWWTGLGTVEPPSNDWRPFFPWFGVVLAGLIGARLVLARGLPGWLVRWRAENALTRALVWGGRHSLLVYLVHQPVFLAVLYMVARAIGPVPDAGLPDQDEPFLSSCVQQCTASGPEPQVCTNVCKCIVGEVRRQPLVWQRLVRDALSPADQDLLQGFTHICVQKTLN